MLGLALDLGRVYIAKNETQSFTDTAALAAALALNDANFTAAKDAVTGNTKNRWNMATSDGGVSSRPDATRLLLQERAAAFSSGKVRSSEMLVSIRTAIESGKSRFFWNVKIS